MTITREQIQDLRKPFRADQVKFKIQTQPKGDKLEGWGVVVSYLDARDVAERLDVVIGGEWSDEYNLFGKALECSLTVCGVTRRDVGDAPNPKELYSDAFKRAAVKFGVGAFLYRMPTIMAKLSRKDMQKPWGLTEGAKASLRAIADAVATGNAPATRYPDLMLLSEYQAPEAIGEEVPAPPSEQTQEAQQAPPRSPSPPRPPQGPTDPIGEELGQRLHAQLGAMLKGTPHESMTHAAFATTITGREVAHLRDLTRDESRKVHAAAKAEREARAA